MLAARREAGQKRTAPSAASGWFCLTTTRQFLRFELRRGSLRCDESLGAAGWQPRGFRWLGLEGLEVGFPVDGVVVGVGEAETAFVGDGLAGAVGDDVGAAPAVGDVAGGAVD